MDLNRVVHLLDETLKGDATGIDELRLATQAQLQEAGQALGGDLRFGRATTLRVLDEWTAGRLTDEQVRWWAILMFIGAFPQEWTPVGWKVHHDSQPLHVSYSDDDEVNDVVFRLKDIGGQVDAEITSNERTAMVLRLLRPPGA